MFRNESDKLYHIDRIYWEKLHGMLVEALAEKGTSARTIALAMTEDLTDKPSVITSDLERSLKSFLFSVRYAARGLRPDPDLTGEFRAVDQHPTPPAALQYLIASMLGYTRDEHKIAQALLHLGLTRKHVHALFREDLGQIVDDALIFGRSRIENVSGLILDAGSENHQQQKVEVTASAVVADMSARGSDSITSLTQDQLQAIATAINALF